jgi:hypothetical protein
VPEELIIGRDFYVDPDGRYVFTEAYLRAQGRCCGNGCRHCPYDHVNVPRRDADFPNASADQAGE